MAEYLTIKELASYASFHPNTLKKWLHRGMPHYRIGRNVRVKRSEFDAWMKKFREDGASKTASQAIAEALQEVSA